VEFLVGTTIGDLVENLPERWHNITKGQE